MKLPQTIRIQGARVHNLKNVSLELPRHQFIVITGKSGSGKSSLAFDTIYAEGQRRYVESLSTYARQFIKGFEKPDVDAIEGLSPPVAIDQRAGANNPRSTVGTMTEIYDHLRLLYSSVGVAHCLGCLGVVQRQSVAMFLSRVRKQWTTANGQMGMITVPFPLIQKKDIAALKRFLLRQQCGSIVVGGEARSSGEFAADAESWIGKPIEVEVSAIRREDLERAGFQSQLEGFLHLGRGALHVRWDDGIKLTLNNSLYCERCDRTMPPFEPRHFSFNSPYGACEGCGGLGTQWIVDSQLVVPNTALTLSEGAIRPLSRLLPHQGGVERVLEALSKTCSVPLDIPVREMTKEQRDRLFHGIGNASDGDMRGGMIGFLSEKYEKSDSEYVKSEIERTMRLFACSHCQGKRLRPEALAVTVNDFSIAQVVGLPLQRLREFLAAVGAGHALSAPNNGRNGKNALQRVVELLSHEMISRLDHLIDVGLDYLTLDRAVTTLAGGEAQRIRLATQLQSHLVDLVYVLDEPSIGLHQRDNIRLIRTLQQLRDLGNTVIVVEHDEETIRMADYVVDMGPGAGTYGGMVVAKGIPKEIEQSRDSITGAYLSGAKRIELPGQRRHGNGKTLTVHNATAFNLKNITVPFPLGTFVAVTGVSGSGKSTLVDDIVAKALLGRFYHAKDAAGEHRQITGVEHLDKVIMIDQSAIGRTPRSNPATYTGIFTLIRDLFIQVPEAKVKGLKAGHFSFNVRGGRCEACQGGGWITVSMQFLPDMTVECDACEGKRYLPEILDVRWRDRNIAEVLKLTVEEALEFFHPTPEWDTKLLLEKLSILERVGLGYLELGQPATTLSGGEAQRIKLGTELSRRSTGRTLYMLDEPTTGLHADDIVKLLKVLQELVDLGNTVVVIEHNLDVIAASDWVIDLGPDGGEHGGQVVAQGTPEEVVKTPDSWTGQALKKHFERFKGALAPLKKVAIKTKKVQYETVCSS